MNLNGLTLLIIFLFAAGVGAQQPLPSASQSASLSSTPAKSTSAPTYSIDAWKTFVSTTGNFSVLFPTTPKDETSRFRLEAGMAEDHRYVVPTASANFQAAYTYLSENIATPESMRTRFGGLLKSLKANPKLTWVSGGESSFEGNPGIEFKVQSIAAEGSVMIWSRQYFAYGCVYEVTTRYLKKDSEPKEPTLFMESFKLLGPPLTRPFYATPSPDSRPDFTPLSQNLYSISAQKLQENALEKPAPKFKNPSRSRDFSGSLTLLITVSEDGKVEQADPVNGPSYFYDEAVKTAKKWTFKPFLRDGKPVKVQGQLLFKYKFQSN